MLDKIVSAAAAFGQASSLINLAKNATEATMLKVFS
jgi:hypothetical protein